jgi:hypothetical protein
MRVSIMGNVFSNLDVCNTSVETLANESSLAGDVMSFNKAVENGAKLTAVKKMDKDFLEKLAIYPEISYPKRVLAFAEETNDNNLVRKLLGNFVNNSKFDVTTLKFAIMHGDALAVSNILEKKPWLSNQQIKTHMGEGLLPCPDLKYYANPPVYENNAEATELQRYIFKLAVDTALIRLENNPVVANVKPLDVALYMATDNSIRLGSKESADLNTNLQIIDSLVKAGADCRNKMSTVNMKTFFQTSKEFVLSKEKVTPMEYARKFTNDNVIQVLYKGIEKDKKNIIEKMTGRNTRDNFSKSHVQ